MRFETFSIKTLTLLGFSLVALPLIAALIYSAAQVDQLAKQGENAVFDSAQLLTLSRVLSDNLNQMERYASQYVILSEQDLLGHYLSQEQQVLTVLNAQSNLYQDSQLLILKDELLHKLIVVQLLIAKHNSIALSLESLQSHFRNLVQINRNISIRINELVSLQAQQVKESAVDVRKTLLNSLFIIPVILCVALFFIVLITKPLKKLTTKIQGLEQGDFDKEIVLQSSPEINEIVYALELMRTRLHALELQKSSFIRHISHELKTPLAAIREGAELLYDHSVGQLNDDQQEISHIIRSSVNRLQRLIEDLLNFNIILDSTSLQDCQQIDISKLIRAVTSENSLAIKRKKLQVTYSANELEVRCNEKQLSVVIDNILSNAIKYSPIGGKISIDIRKANKQLILTIADQGTGIAEEHVKQIFDAFYQGKAPQDNQIKGSGLGLTIVKELLMRINGSIKVISQTQAPSGTCIEINLPDGNR